ncbi:BTAD domain-containing putative transcriptional regulator [Thalassococcus sp. S3]|uniref:BTAD domain-containing putative transcriptional regulator n=1 Tax=Thalassococcus sp. S3 TaxID=2017482 RepID=UPI0013EE9C27|nr:AAA family ATPase [Thalassococcus sp. S3]
MSEKRLRLDLLGGYTLSTSDGMQINLPTRKSWALLGYLSQYPDTGKAREEVATLLWAQSGEAQARASLRQELSVLRRGLTGHEGLAVRSKGGLLHLERGDVQIDTHLFWHSAQTDPKTAIILYNGPFFKGLTIQSDPFESWLRMERERHRDAALSCARRVLRDELAQGTAGEISKTAKVVLEIDPTIEDAHQALMQVAMDAGNRSEALRQYSRCQDALRRELDVEPSDETKSLAERIRAQTPGPRKKGTASTEIASAATEKRNLAIACFGWTNAKAFDTGGDPETLADGSDQFHAMVELATKAHAGRIIQRYTDRIVAAFGYPRADEHDPARAVRACLDLLRSAAQDNRDGADPAFTLRCGVAYSEVLIRTDPHHPDGPPNLTGQPILTAADLEHQAQDGTLLVSAEAAAMAGADFETAPAEGTTPPALRIVGERNFHNRFEASRADASLTHFVGRQSELEQIQHHWAQALSGDGQTLAVLGEPGIGKSRLLHEAQNALTPRPVTIIHIHGSPHHMQTALAPFTACLTHLLQLKPAGGGAVDPGALDLWFSSDPLKTPRKAVYRDRLRDLLCQTVPGAPSLPPNAKPEDMIDAVLYGLARSMSRSPTLLIVEDAHWFDPTSLRTLQALADRIPGQAALMLVTSRTDLEGLSCTDQIALDRLSKYQSRQILDARCDPGLSRDVIDETVRRASGIPLYLEELSQTIGQDRAVPETLQASLMSRLDQFPEMRDILQVAAIIGPSFEFALLKQVVDLEEAELDARLRNLQAAQLVFQIGRPPYARYEFKHALLQEFVYQACLRDVRTECHHRIAYALEHRDRDKLLSAPEIIAYHYELGGAPQKAVTFLEAAGRQAAQISAHREAAEHFRKALALLRLDDAPDPALERRLLIQLGPQLLATRGFAAGEVRRVYDRARDLPGSEETDLDMSQLLWGHWGNHVVRADIETAAEIGAEVARHATQANDRAGQAAADYMTGVVCFYRGQMGDACTHLRRAVARHQEAPIGEQRLRFGLNISVSSYAYLTWAFTLMGRYHEADSAAAEATRLSESQMHEFGIAFARIFITGMHGFRRDFETTRQHAMVALDLSEGRGFAQWHAQAEMFLGRALERLGNAKGLDLLEHGFNAYLDTGAELARPAAISWLAEASTDRGAPQPAITMIDRTLAITAETGERFFDPELLRIKANVLLRQTPAAVAEREDLLMQALAQANANQTWLLSLRAGLDLALLRREQGRVREASAALADGMRHIPENADFAEWHDARLLLAELSDPPTAESA